LRKISDNHMNFLNKTFSTYIELLNTDAAYTLQVASNRLSCVALIATIFALIATILGILVNWQEVVKLFIH
jgi:hypothetical protein